MLHRLAVKLGDYAVRDDNEHDTSAEVVAYGIELVMQEVLMFAPVSYTHLDVYKRQL